MADSVDRVFVHALNTVKRIPRTGSARPPDADRLKLYGLYKQSMEGDVEGVMSRPENTKSAGDGVSEEEKWEAWHANAGMPRTEAKRQYITTLIETMHRYATTTTEARELVAELQFVWDQIKSNPVSPSGSSPEQYSASQAAQQGESGDALRVLRPLCEDVGEDPEDLGDDDAGALRGGNTGYVASNMELQNQQWRKRIEQALVKITVEIAALRERTEATKFRKGRRRTSLGFWILWLFWASVRHISVDAALLGFLVLWARRRHDPTMDQGLRMLFSWAKMQLRGLRLPSKLTTRSKR